MKASVRITTAGPEQADIIRRALSVGERPGDRSSLKVSSSGSSLNLDIVAKDLGALRAVLNSSLREVKIANEALDG
jgi:tRNA threonylcarbamoyladenosine modification (KEOPS) complex  Pcc1 subunit